MWLYIPGIALAHAQAAADSTLQSSLPLKVVPELYVTSSEKAMLRPLSWHGWRRRHWLRHLYGTVSNPLMADHGAALWISSLRDSRANQLQSREGDKEPAMSAGFGTTSLGSFATYDHDSFCWRTCQGSLLLMEDEPLAEYSAPWPNSGTLRNGVCFPRRRWVPRIDVNDSSSWPTPTSQDSGGNKSASMGAKYRPSLRRINKLWPTAKAEDSQSCGNHPHATGGGDTLTGVAKLWQTPATDSFRSRGGDRTDEMGLDQQARLFWMATTATNPDGSERDRTDQLARQVQMWQTPRAADAHGAGYQRDHGMKGRERLSLTGEAKMFPTPKALDWKNQSHKGPLSHSPDLSSVVEQYLTPLTGSNFPSSRPDQTSASSGDKSSTSRPNSRPRLNALFVEWLMNWPRGWSHPSPIVWTDYEYWVTASSLWLRLLLSESSPKG